MRKTIEGIVLKASDYQEKSKILQVYSLEHGLISLYLKGANQYRSKQFVLAQPLTHASFSIYYSEGLNQCFSGEIINSFQNLKLNFEQNIYVYHLFELILKTLEKHAANPYLYQLLLLIMNAIDAGASEAKRALLTNCFELKLLYFLGVAPELSCCVECGRNQAIATFDLYKGGLICKHCLTPQTFSFSKQTLTTIIQLYYAKIEAIPDLPDVSTEVLKDLRFIIDQYYQYHLGIRTNSRKYLQNFH